MTTPTENQATQVEPATPKQGLWEWFWRGKALRRARAEQSASHPVGVYTARASIALEVGERTLDPPMPWSSGNAAHLASALFVEAIGWSLRAAHSARDAASTELRSRPAEAAELEQLVTSEQELLAGAAGDVDVLARVTANLISRSFETRALPPDEAIQAARELGRVARGVQQEHTTPQAATERLKLQRVVRLGVPLGLLLGLALAVGYFRDKAEIRADLAAGKPWRASSSYETACVSPQRRCDPNKTYFFHTLEESNPWLEIDLTRTQDISKVHVFNRQDCCAERAAPLVVEVSTDQQKWHEVARKRDSFDDWRGSFPTVKARWVRFRVAKRSHLHLLDVRVLP